MQSSRRKIKNIVVAYDHNDKKQAGMLVNALTKYGYSVWWDEKIRPGATYAQVIEEELKAAVCVVVLWSQKSVRSSWVINEAATAIDGEEKKLVPIVIEETEVPLQFRDIHSARLIGWNGNPNHPDFQPVLDAIQLIARPTRNEERPESLFRKFTLRIINRLVKRNNKQYES